MNLHRKEALHFTTCIENSADEAFLDVRQRAELVVISPLQLIQWSPLPAADAVAVIMVPLHATPHQHLLHAAQHYSCQWPYQL